MGTVFDSRRPVAGFCQYGSQPRLQSFGMWHCVCS